MKINFSASRKAFFAEGVTYKDLPDDLVSVSADEHATILSILNAGREAILVGGKWMADKKHAKELEQLKSQYAIEAKIKAMEAFVQNHLDETARRQGLGFDDIKSAMLGAQFPGDHQASSQALGAWYYSVWAACKSLLHLWQNGSIDEPTAEDVMAALPKYIAPQAEK